MGEEPIPEFGGPPGGDCFLRPGGYVVIVRDGCVAVVVTPEGVYLPGGGQEAGESPEGAAVREAAEECGLRVTLGERIGVADDLAVVEGRWCRKRCTYFRAHVVGSCEVIEADHELKWLPVRAAVAELRHGSQRWAVVRACGAGEG